MRFRAFMWQLLLSLPCVAIAGLAFASEVAKGEEPKPATKAAAKPTAPTDDLPGTVLAKVDNVPITRADLVTYRRQLIPDPRLARLSNKQLLDMLIERRLLEGYFEKEGLRASDAEAQREVQRQDDDLRQRGITYALGPTAEEHAQIVRFNLSNARWIARIQDAIDVREIKDEFDAHPEWYDGSSIRVGQILVETVDLGNDPKQLAKAKERIERLHELLAGGKDFGQLARDYSNGPAAPNGGDLGWKERKEGPEEDEPLLAAAWALKVGDFTKPIQGVPGWYILKVNDRRPARFTFFGSRPNVLAELTRRRQEAILAQLRANVTLEK